MREKAGRAMRVDSAMVGGGRRRAGQLGSWGLQRMTTRVHFETHVRARQIVGKY